MSQPSSIGRETSSDETTAPSAGAAANNKTRKENWMHLEWRSRHREAEEDGRGFVKQNIKNLDYLKDGEMQ
jgi:hypothetical protein